MQTFHILYLREHLLDHSERIEVFDLLDAIDHAMEKPPELTAEIRRNGGRIGIVGPSWGEALVRGAHDGTSGRLPEAEITTVMRSRLQIVR